MISCYRATRYAHWYDEQYRKAYIPFYTNMSSFIFGMIAGLLYCKHKQGHIDLSKSKVCYILFLYSELLFAIDIYIYTSNRISPSPVKRL